MADHVITLRLTRLAACWPSVVTSACLSYAWNACALGPMAPFVPPGTRAAWGEATPQLGLSAAGDSEQFGLRGIRLRRNVGALIDGQWVPLGTPTRGGRLESVNRQSVVLRFADGHTEQLDLYPAEGTEKTPTALAPDAASQPSSAAAAAGRAASATVATAPLRPSSSGR